MTKKQKELLNSSVSKMKLIAQSGDFEAAHSDADDLLCEILDKLGFKELTDMFEVVGKWYC